MENEFDVNQENTENAEVAEVVQEQQQTTTISQEDIARRLQELKMEQNLPLGFIFGLVAALVGALLWAVITVATNYQIGYMALAVGFMVGFAVRTGGKGIEPIYGIIGAVLALVGCLLGNFFSQVGFIAHHFGMGYFEVFSAMDFSLIMDVMVESFSVIDVLFYGIAIYEGYRFSFRKIDENLVTAM